MAVVSSLLAGCALPFYSGPLPNEPKGETFAQVAGARIHYVDRGAGPAVVLIHGFGASLDYWEKLIAALEKTHRVLALDMKGFGMSDRPSGDYSLPAQAALVFELMRHVGIERASVVGHSWGGGVALAMTLQDAARVEKLVLLDAAAYDDAFPTFVDWARVPGLGEILFRLFYKEGAEDKATVAFYDPSFVTQRMIDKIQESYDAPGAVAAALATIRDMRFAQQATRYSTIEQKTLVVWGREDRIMPLSFGERLHRDIPNSDLKVYSQCGHMPMREASAELVRDVGAFLADDRSDEAPKP